MGSILSVPTDSPVDIRRHVECIQDSLFNVSGSYERAGSLKRRAVDDITSIDLRSSKRIADASRLCHSLKRKLEQTELFEIPTPKRFKSSSSTAVEAGLGFNVRMGDDIVPFLGHRLQHIYVGNQPLLAVCGLLLLGFAYYVGRLSSYLYSI